MTLPDGNSNSAISMIQEKAQQWINAIRNGHLHHHNVWFLLKIQFFSRISYGLCSSTATFKELEHVLHHQYYQISLLEGLYALQQSGAGQLMQDFLEWDYLTLE